MTRRLLSFLICVFAVLSIAAQNTYYGNVGETITLPEPTPPSSAYTVMQMVYSTTSEHLYVAPGTSSVKILSYFSYKEVVKCDYRMVRQYTTYDSDGKPHMWEDWQNGTQYYYISCLGSDPNPDPDPDPDPDPGNLSDGDYFQDYTPEGHYMLFIFTHLYGEACAIVVPNKYGGSCVGAAKGKVTIPSTAKGYPVRRIANAAFYKLSDLTELVIPSSVKSLDSYAAISCSGLKTITCMGDTPPTSLSSDGSIFDYGIFFNSILYVPKGCKSKYSSAKGWENFKTIREIGEEESVDPISIVLPNYTENIKVGETITLTPTIAPSNATTTLTWTSSDTSVATVSQSGVVKGLQVGESKITVTTHNGKSAYCYVKVAEDKIYVTSISLNATTCTMTVGDTKQLTATVSPSNATDKSISWTSNNNSVATVSSSGLITAKAQGSATITCKANDGSGETATCSVNVNSSVIEPTSISVSPSSKTVKVGDTFYCSYTLSPSNATSAVTWSSDNSSIATVNSSGKVTAKSVGSTYINANTANGKTDWCKVTVESATLPKLSLSASPSGGQVTAGTTATLTAKANGSTVSGCDIYFTTNGSNPSRNNGTKYSSGITISSDCTLKAIAYKDGYEDSDVLTVNYTIKQSDPGSATGNGTIDNPFNAVAAKNKASELSVGETSTQNYYVKGKISSIRNYYDAQYGTAIFYISDDGSTNDQFYVYGSYYLDNKPWVEGNSQIAVGDDVIIYGKFANYKGILEMADKENYVYSHNGRTSQTSTSTCADVINGTDGNVYRVTGIVKSITDTAYGNWYLSDKTGEIYIYGTRDKDGKNGRNNSIEAWGIEEGDEITVEGPRKDYKGIIELVDVTVLNLQKANNGSNNVSKIIQTGYSTFFSSKSAYKLPNGLSAQVVTGATNGKLAYKTIADGSLSEVIPKGLAVILVSENRQVGTYTLTPVQSGATYTGTNLLYGRDETTTTTGNGLHYKLSYGPSGTKWDDVFGWYWGAQSGAPFQIEGHKAWLVIPKNGTRAAGFSVNGEALDIEDNNREMITNNHYYDLQGRRVNQPAKKGIYIIDGKKVVK